MTAQKEECQNHYYHRTPQPLYQRLLLRPFDTFSATLASIFFFPFPSITNPFHFLLCLSRLISVDPFLKESKSFFSFFLMNNTKIYICVYVFFLQNFSCLYVASVFIDVWGIFLMIFYCYHHIFYPMLLG